MSQEEKLVGYPKIARLKKTIIITEKIDGKTGQILITDYGDMLIGSQKRWLSASSDNFGFYDWAIAHFGELQHLGPGRHFGEWWGGKIQRGYGVTEKRFSLFDTIKWAQPDAYYLQSYPGHSEGVQVNSPACCDVVPELYRGEWSSFYAIEHSLETLQENGSFAAAGFMNPEGIVIYHTESNQRFKLCFEDDHKGNV